MRRKSRAQPDRSRLAKYALAGSGLAVALAGVFYAVVTGLAQRSLASDQQLPAALSDRIWLARATLGKAAAALLQHIIYVGGRLWPVIVVALIGAVVGVGIYLLRAGYIRLRPRHRGLIRKRKRPVE